MMTIALILLKKLNAYVLPNTKVAFRKEQATCEKKFICINDYIKKRNHLPFAARWKRLCLIRTIFAQNEQLKCSAFSLSYLLLRAVQCSPGRQNWSKCY